uniref:Secreted protein n=1 Tax=Bursaphelenchus xylophilus TaxID=6326 RepID=A0A1I7SKL2_BURXY
MDSLLVCTFIGFLAQKVHGYTAHQDVVTLTSSNQEFEIMSDPFRLIFTQDPSCTKLYQCVCFPTEDAEMRVVQMLDGLPECTRQGGFVCGAEGIFSIHLALDGTMFSVENAELAHLPKPKIQMRQNALLRQVPVIQMRVQLGGNCQKPAKVEAVSFGRIIEV